MSRHEEIAHLLSDPDVMSDQNRNRDLSREYAHLEPIVQAFRDYEQTREDLQTAQEMARDDDPELRRMGEDETDKLGDRLTDLELQLRKHLIPRAPGGSMFPIIMT